MLSLILAFAQVATSQAVPARPHAPTDMRSARELRQYVRDLRNYESALRLAGRMTKEEEEWCEEQGDFFGMRAHLLMMRAGPDGQISVDQYKKAIQHKKDMEPDTNPAFVGTFWQSIGPNSLDGTTSSQLDPVTGRVNAVKYNPANANNYWVAGATGGLMVTSDNGATYQTKSDFWETTYTSAVAIDATNTNRIYVATGDYPGWWGYGQGLMRSTNGGSTWTQELVAELQGCEVSDILVDPDNPSTVLASAGRGTRDLDGAGVWRSTDFGNTWTKVLNGGSLGYAKLSAGIRANNVRWIYASQGSSGSMVRSSDGGQSWTPADPPGTGMVIVAASKTHRDVVYAYVGVDGPNGDDDGEVYKSTDRGDNWTPITGNLGNLTAANSDFRQATYNFMFGVMNTASDGSGDDILLLGMVDCFALRNPQSSTTWQFINGLPGQTRFCHADYHGFDQHPTIKNAALIGNDGGVYQLLYTSVLGFIFSTKNAGLVLTEHVFTAPHPDASNNPNYVNTGMWHLGCAYSPNNVNDWRSVSGGDGMWTSIDDTNPLIQFVSSQRGENQTVLDLRATTNGWVSSATYSTSTVLTEDFAFASPWSEVPGDSGAIYLAGETLYEFDLSTGSPVWTKSIGGAFFSASDGECATAIRAVAGPGVFVGTSSGRLFGSLTPTLGVPIILNFSEAISSIDQHPSDPDDLLVTLGGVNTGPGTSGAVWEVLDATSGSPTYVNRSGSGQNALPGIGVNWIERDPYDPTFTWYAATDLGVFYTRNRGADWYDASVTLGLPNTMVYHLEVSDNILYASTFGRGIWRMSLYSGPPQTTAISFASSEVTGGNTTTAHITLSRQAPPGGIDIPITSNNLAAIPTQSVHFPGGVTGANVQIDTNVVTGDSNVTVTANLGGSPVTDSIIVRECVVNDLLLVDIVGGDSSLAGVAINRAAPTGGLDVDLVDNDSGTTVPATVTIPEGATVGLFAINTQLTPVNRVVSIQASGPGSGWQESFNRLPVFVTSVTITPNPVWNTLPSAIRVTLNRAAPISGFPMAVDIGTPLIATAPQNFTLPQGATSGTNPITTFYVPVDSTAGFRVWDPYGQFWEPTLQVKHVGVSNITFAPNPLLGGNSGNGTVTLDRTIDTTLILSVFTDRADIFSPTDSIVFSGSNTGTYQGDSVAVSTPQVAKITARIGAQSVAGAFAEMNLNILPTQVVVVPSAFTVNLGQVSSGNLASLAADDGNALRVCKFIVPNQNTPPVTVQLDATAPVLSCSALTFSFKAKMAHTGLFSQELQTWNWQTANWDTAATRTDTVNTAYATRDIIASGTLSRLLNPADGRLRARYRIRQTGPSATTLWCHDADKANWILVP